MTEAIANDLGGDAGAQQLGRVGAPQIMEAGVVKAALVDKPVKSHRESGRSPGRAVGRTEDQVAVVVAGTARQAQSVLLDAMAAQHLHGGGRQRHGAPTGAGLGLLEVERAAGLFKGVFDAQLRGVEVNVATAQSEQFAAT